MSSKILPSVLLLGFLNFTAIAADSLPESRSANSSASDLQRIQGRWTTLAGAQKKLVVDLEIQDRKVKVTIKTPHGIQMRAEGEVQLDESTLPRRLDWKGFEGLDGQEIPTIVGIYKVENDTFTVCNGGFHGARPVRFEPGDGALADVIVFARPTKKSESDSTVARSTSDQTPSRGKPITGNR